MSVHFRLLPRQVSVSIRSLCTVLLFIFACSLGTLSFAANTTSSSNDREMGLPCSYGNGTNFDSFSATGSDYQQLFAPFTLNMPAPTMASFTPIISGTGTVVTITGTGFTGATEVTFGGMAAQSFTVINDSTVSATVGSGATGRSP